MYSNTFNQQNTTNKLIRGGYGPIRSGSNYARNSRHNPTNNSHNAHKEANVRQLPEIQPTNIATKVFNAISYGLMSLVLFLYLSSFLFSF